MVLTGSFGVSGLRVFVARTFAPPWKDGMYQTGSETGGTALVSMPPTDRRGLVVLTQDECIRHLEESRLGRFAVVLGGDPMVYPVLFCFADGAVHFRTATGDKMDAVWLHGPVAFEVDGWDAETRRGWSVVVRGRAEAVYDVEESKRLDQLPLEDWLPPRMPTTWVRMRLAEISGRRIPERDELPAESWVAPN